MRRAIIWLAGLAVMAFVGQVRAQDARDDFRANCTSCHTIGGGVLTGPDLEGVGQRRKRPWLVRFLQGPRAVIEGGDPYAQKLLQEMRGVVMPDIAGMTEKRAGKLLDLIEAESKREKSEFAKTAVSDRPLTAADIAVGQALFRGDRRLEGGAPPCMSCHAVNGLGGLGGGQLGPRLDDVYARLNGRKTLAAWLAAPQTPTMKPIFLRHPIDAETEVLPLVAFLKAAAERGETESPSDGLNLVILAIFGAVALLLSLDAVWRRRFRAVRKPLVGGRS